PGGRLLDRDGRRARRRRAQPASAGVQRPPRAAVRLLHPRDAHERDGVAAGDTTAFGRGDREGHPGEHLSLHGLLEHRQGDQGGLWPGGAGVSETTVTPEQTVVQEPTQETRSGQNVPRKEDKRRVRGEGVFFDDVKPHNMGFVHFVRSPYAHAKIRSVDVSAALEFPGVHGTLTGDEVATLTDPFFQISSPPGAHLKDYCLAVGKARFVADPVAPLVAPTPAGAPHPPPPL